MAPNEHKRLAVQSRKLSLLKETLYNKGVDGIWWRTVPQFEKEAVLRKDRQMNNGEDRQLIHHSSYRLLYKMDRGQSSSR